MGSKQRCRDTSKAKWPQTAVDDAVAPSVKMMMVMISDKKIYEGLNSH